MPNHLRVGRRGGTGAACRALAGACTARAVQRMGMYAPRASLLPRFPTTKPHLLLSNTIMLVGQGRLFQCTNRGACGGGGGALAGGVRGATARMHSRWQQPLSNTQKQNRRRPRRPLYVACSQTITSHPHAADAHHHPTPHPTHIGPQRHPPTTNDTSHTSQHTQPGHTQPAARARGGGNPLDFRAASNRCGIEMLYRHSHTGPQ